MNNAIEKLVEMVKDYEKQGKITGEYINLAYSILILGNKYISVEEFCGKGMGKTINLHFIPTSDSYKKYGKEKVVYVNDCPMVRLYHNIYNSSNPINPTYGALQFESGYEDSVEHLDISVSDIYKIDGI